MAPTRNRLNWLGIQLLFGVLLFLSASQTPMAAAQTPASTHGRTVPVVTRLSQLRDHDLPARVVPLPEADTRAARHYFGRRFGRLETQRGPRLYNPEIILVKFRNAQHVAALRVEPLREVDALQKVRQRNDVEFAELDSFESRQFNPNDPLLSSQ